MVVGSNSVKLQAKEALKDNWINAIITALLISLAFFSGYIVFSLVSSVLPLGLSGLFFILFIILLISPLVLGVIRNFWYLIGSKAIHPIQSFYYFSNKNLYLRAIKLVGNLIVKIIGHSVIIFLPTVVFEIVSSEHLYRLLDIPIPLWITNFEYIAVFLRTMSTVFLFFVMMKYYSAPILAVSNDEMDIEEAIYMSKIISKGSLLEFIYLFFSFLGWIVASFFYFPFLFTLPFMLTAFAIHTKFAIEDYNKQISNLEEENSSYSVGI